MHQRQYDDAQQRSQQQILIHGNSPECCSRNVQDQPQSQHDRHRDHAATGQQRDAQI